MKNIINKILTKTGYEFNKISLSSSTSPFTEMKRLCQNQNNIVIFDVGAHFGKTARRFRELFPKSHIYSFEPFPDSFEKAQQSLIDSKYIKVFNYGLSNVSGEQIFNSNSNSETNSLLSTDVNGPSTWGPNLLETKELIKSKFKTLDSVISELEILKVNILKLDVQGAEYMVMEGAIESLNKSLIDIIYTEIIIQPTYNGQKRFDEVLTIFYNSGFDLHNIYNLSLSPLGKLRQVDVIFTRRDLILA